MGSGRAGGLSECDYDDTLAARRDADAAARCARCATTRLYRVLYAYETDDDDGYGGNGKAAWPRVTGFNISNFLTNHEERR